MEASGNGEHCNTSPPRIGALGGDLQQHSSVNVV